MDFIDEVRQDRTDLARVLKKHAGIRRIVEDLYPDSAHFIYELLQNADDAQADHVNFTLNTDSLVFEHNGRTFSQKDIWAITDIGDGTKPDNNDKIGRFGVGFKAVFAYTESPLIWSPTYCFEIQELVLPRNIEAPSDLNECTRFKFPFNNSKKPIDNAFIEVKTGLDDLAETTLLFLNHLESLTWTVQSLTTKILRVRHSSHHVEVMKVVDGNTVTSSHFLLFDAPVTDLKNQRVAVAFPLVFLREGDTYVRQQPISAKMKIVPARPGQVAVYFPAEKETSGLRFHIHAPFVPELSRASIKETPANAPLFEQLARLVVKSMYDIQKLGLLNAEFLNVLPNPSDSIPERYRAIQTSLVREFQTQPLTPTQSGSYAPATSLRRSRAAIKEVLGADDLSFLTRSNDRAVDWAVNAPLKNGDADRFLTSLGMKQWDLNELVEALLREGGRKASAEVAIDFQNWLGKKDPDWHQALYSWLFSEIRHRDDMVPLQNARIVLLQDGKHEVGSDCHFPDDSSSDNDHLIRRVDSRAYSSGSNKTQQSNARKFLEDIGVRTVGEAEVVESILKARYVLYQNSISNDNRVADLERFIRLVENEPKRSDLFQTFLIFESSHWFWAQPNSIYIDNPFQDTGLTAYYACYKGQNVHSLSDWYKSSPIPVERIAKFAIATGAVKELAVTDAKCKENPDWLYLRDAPGDRVTVGRQDTDFTIPGLKSLLASPSIERSQLLWRTMCAPRVNQNCLEATYKKSKSVDSRKARSQLVHELALAAWIPQTGGRFVKPSEACQEHLPHGFAFDPGWKWIKAIGFGSEAARLTAEFQRKRAVAKELGFEDDDALERAQRFASLSPEDQERLLAELEMRTNTDLPEHESNNPARRAEREAQEAKEAQGREFEIRSRSVSKWGAKIKKVTRPFLMGEYTNGEQELVCQICKRPMPFRLKEGSYYFEAVQLLPELKKFHRPNYLALCPNHAAMFWHANDERESLGDLIRTADGTSVPVTLAGESHQIYFTQVHLDALRTVLNVEGEEAKEANSGG